MPSRVVLSFAVLMLLAACGGGGSKTSSGATVNPLPTNSATSTPTPSASATSSTLSGNYAGAATDSIAGSGYVSLQLSQSGSASSGYWGVAYPGYGFVNGGTLSGTASGNALTAVATSQVTGGCSVNITATLSSGSMSGTYKGIGTGCTSDTGTFTTSSITVPTLGNYAGTVTDSVAGLGSLSFNLSQNAVFLAGTWSNAFTNIAYNNSGSAYGVVIGTNKVAFGAIPTSASACRFVVVGSVSGSSITGSYTAPTSGTYACSVADTGTFSLSAH